MKTAVITDSASYLDPVVAAKYNITVLPITVIFGSQEYHDGVDISSQEFLKNWQKPKITNYRPSHHGPDAGSF